MQKQFIISLNGQNLGPFTKDQILQRLTKKETQWMDYIYDEEARDWVLLMEHHQFTSAFNEGVARTTSLILTPGSSPTPDSSNSSVHAIDTTKEKAWYLLREGNNFGPFSVLDLVHMLQEKTLFEYDFVWQKGMASWKRIAEVSHFNVEKMRELKQSLELHTKDESLSDTFFRRRHARARYGCSLIVHDHKKLFKGHSLELSEGGAGIAIHGGEFNPGQSLYLHFKPGDAVPPFNALCTVVSKRWMSEKNQEHRYGVKFDGISLTARASIRDFTEKKKAA